LALKIEHSTIRAIENALPPRKEEKTKITTPFWWGELDRLKRITRAKRKSYQKARDANLRQRKLIEYQQAKEEYREKIEQRKIETWDNYVNTNLTLDPWGNPYKICMSKMSTTTISTLEKPDGTKTSNWKDSAELLMRELIPQDDENNETIEQQ